MSTVVEQAVPRRTVPLMIWVGLAACAAALGVAFKNGIETMVHTWLNAEEYSHGPLIPLISGFLIWQRRFDLAQIASTRDVRAGWMGAGIIVFGLLLNGIGLLATLNVIQQYALVIVIYGIVVSLFGPAALRLLLAPLLLLWTMIPLPNFFLNGLSLNLKLLSSQLGVAFIHFVGISVFLQGNVIDLGSYQLQVADACSGLRYLFPLLTLGFVMATFFNAAFWKRAVLFLSAIPLTILMNSFRIGTIGVMVDRWGPSMAEGFLHEFQGWAVFMLCGLLMVAEIMLLARIGKERRHWREVFGLEFPQANGRAAYGIDHLPPAFVGSVAVIALAGVVSLLMPNRAEAVPVRESLSSFPLALDGWQGRRGALERIYIDALKFDDYVLIDYNHAGSPPVDFYVAWYNSQRSGESAHSPRSCLPAGGWKVDSLTQATLPGVNVGGVPLRVNRVLISQGNQRQLTYYWFQQRGRVITSEYLVKWYLFWDALTRNRTDGALVRLIVPVDRSDSVQQADKTLTKFAAAISGELPRFVPN